MSRRAEKNVGGRPPKPPEDHRQPLSTRVLPDTLTFIVQEKEQTGLSRGVVVDAMARVYQAHPEEHLPEIKLESEG